MTIDIDYDKFRQFMRTFYLVGYPLTSNAEDFLLQP